MLKACVNGARSRDDHAALPVTSVELARDVAAVAAVGVDAVHLHVKDDMGADTLDAHALAAALSAVREAAPGLPLGGDDRCLGAVKLRGAGRCRPVLERRAGAA